MILPLHHKAGGNWVNTAKNTMKQLSAYNIFWAIATPVTGKATKADLRIAAKNGFTSFGNHFIRHSGNLEILKEKCQMKLGKAYRITIITDKQFGMIDGRTKDVLAVATTLQKEQSYTI